MEISIYSIKKQRELAGDVPASTFYSWVERGLWPRPIKLGPRRAGNPASEVHAILAARIRGESEKSIIKLVQDLEAARAELAA